MRVHVWAEDRPLPEAEAAMRRIYPNGIQGQIASFLRAEGGFEVTAATMQDPGQGLSPAVMDGVEVLVFWSHKHWRELDSQRVDELQNRVLDGMGLVLLHSAHASLLFARLMGTRTQCLRWREADERQRVWITAPAHPIAQGLGGEYFEIPADETYGEYFEIPQPETQVFLTQAAGGELLRSGCCWSRGRGRIFYFSAGHETYPVYHQPEVQRVICNAVRWAGQGTPLPAWPGWARQAPPLAGPG